MSKKKEYNAYKEGMVDGAKPFEEKITQYKNYMQNIGRSIKHQNNCLQDQQEKVIDILQEHDNRLNQIQNPELFDLTNMEEDELKIVFAFLIDITKKYNINDFQKRMLKRLYDEFGLTPSDIDLKTDDVEKIENIKTQKSICRTVLEYLYLNPKKEFIDEYKEYFSLSKKTIDNIENEIKEKLVQKGEDGILEIYDHIESSIPKKVYPILEIDTDVQKFEIDKNDIYIYFEYNDYSEKVFRRESDCRDAYAVNMSPYLQERDEYVYPSSPRYIGNKIVEFYGDLIKKDVDIIIDYVNIYKFNMDIEDVLNIRDNYRNEILDLFKQKMESVDSNFKLHGLTYYRDRLTIGEDIDYVETLFGGMKEVTAYDETGPYDCMSLVNEMMDELVALVNYVSIDIWAFVKNNYITRLNGIVKNINTSVGNV